MIRFRAIFWTATISLGVACHFAGCIQAEIPNTSLIYEIEPEDESSKIPSEKMKQLLKAANRRLRACNYEGTVRSLDKNRIEVRVSITDKQDLERLNSILSKPGTFELAILANQVDHAHIISKAERIERDLKVNGRLVAGWREVGLNSTGEPKEIGDGGDVVSRENKRSRRKEYLVVFELQRVTGDYISRAYKTTDEDNRPALGLNFNKEGGVLLRKLTMDHRVRSDGFTRRLAILLDDKIHAAPDLRAVITNYAMITGKFTTQQLEDLVTILHVGGFPLKLKQPPQSARKFEPSPK